MLKTPEEVVRKVGVDRRGLTSLCMFFSFLWLPFSGIAIHIADPDPMDTVHHMAMSVHNLAAILFFVSVVLHLVLNWKPMTRHLINRARSFGLRSEVVYVAGTITVLIALFGSHALLAR